MLKLLRFFFYTARSLWRTRALTKRLSSLPMPALLEEWLSIMGAAADGKAPALRPGVSAADLLSAEIRLGNPLPPELRQFYLHTDGIDWSADENRSSVPRVRDIRKHTLVQGNCEGLAIFPARLLATDAEQVVPLDTTGDMLELGSGGRTSTLLVTQSSHGLPLGTILYVEGCEATRHDSLSAWLASDAAAISMINDISRSTRK